MKGDALTDRTVDGKCIGCGTCCSDFLPISKEEIRKIRKYVRKNNIKEQKHLFHMGYDLTCPFRDEANRRCVIYQIRPQICREFKCDYDPEKIRGKGMGGGPKTLVSMREMFFR